MIKMIKTKELRLSREIKNWPRNLLGVRSNGVKIIELNSVLGVQSILKKLLLLIMRR